MCIRDRIIAAALIFVRTTFSLSTRMEEVVVSVVLVGSMVGAVVGGVFADRAGRRATLVWGGVLFIAGSDVYKRQLHGLFRLAIQHRIAGYRHRIFNTRLAIQKCQQ